MWIGLSAQMTAPLTWPLFPVHHSYDAASVLPSTSSCHKPFFENINTGCYDFFFFPEMLLGSLMHYLLKILMCLLFPYNN